MTTCSQGSRSSSNQPDQGCTAADIASAELEETEDEDDRQSYLNIIEARVSNLRLLKPDGTLVDVSPNSAPLAEQLASHVGQ